MQSIPQSQVLWWIPNGVLAELALNFDTVDSNTDFCSLNIVAPE